MKKAAIIMCGGKGTRLWPISSANKPKQFLKITNNLTLLENTLNRIPEEYLKIFISNINYKSELDPYIKKDDIAIYEPISRNTGQAIHIACLYMKQKYGINFSIIALPCDHLFDDEKFTSILATGMDSLETNKIITFGIKPTYPEMGFGYIVKDINNKIIKFVEKPSYDRAEELIAQGSLWNSGVFLFKLNNILRLFEKYNSDNLIKCNKSLNNAKIDKNSIILSKDYSDTINISFDCLIMEKIDNGIVLEYKGLWSDIGDWKRLRENFINKDENKIIGDNIKNINTKGSLVYSDSGNVILVGVTDLVVVKFGNDLLIMNKDSNNIFKTFIQQQ